MFRYLTRQLSNPVIKTALKTSGALSTTAYLLHAPDKTEEQKQSREASFQAPLNELSEGRII